MKKTVVAIIGPTAVGKTKLSIRMAKRFDGEIISGDSMQIYKGMDIGTAKIKEEETEGIPHHMIDIKEPDEEFSVADFQVTVRSYIDEISRKGHLPIIVGGSGLYIQAALYNYQFSNEKRDETLTKRLEELIQVKGIMPLYDYLKKIDPEEAKKIHPNNHRRVIRAIEIYETTGKTKSEYQKDQKLESPYNVNLIGLEMDREELYERINKRVDQMVEDGLIQEVESFYRKGYEQFQSMRGIGYKEFIPYLKGEESLEDSIRTLKRNSRRFAKRQFTWFKNKMEVNWYPITTENHDEKFSMILDDLAGFLKNK